MFPELAGDRSCSWLLNSALSSTCFTFSLAGCCTCAPEESSLTSLLTERTKQSFSGVTVFLDDNLLSLVASSAVFGALLDAPVNIKSESFETVKVLPT